MSTSPERGQVLAVTGEFVETALPASDSYNRALADELARASTHGADVPIGKLEAKE